MHAYTFLAPQYSGGGPGGGLIKSYPLINLTEPTPPGSSPPHCTLEGGWTSYTADYTLNDDTISVEKLPNSTYRVRCVAGGPSGYR